MFSRAKLSRTSLTPAMPIPIDPMPNTIRITLAAMPPYSKNLRFMATPFTCDSVTGVSAGQRSRASGAIRRPVAGFPLAGRASSERCLDRRCDYELLVGRHDPSREVPEKTEPPNDCLPDQAVVLAQTAGECEQVQPLERHRHLRYRRRDPIGEHPEAEGIVERPERGVSRLVLQRVVQLVHCQAAVAQEMDERAGVERAGAGSHRDPL